MSIPSHPFRHRSQLSGERRRQLARKNRRARERRLTPLERGKRILRRLLRKALNTFKRNHK